jgi:F0F1-type ATP synthase delta subunit
MIQKGGFTSNKNTVIVESVIPLSPDQIDTLIVHLKLDPKSITVDNRRNPSLVAGIRVMLLGKIIDLSFQNLLNQLTGNEHE